MTKERPILFSAPMVRAILGGRKTQTRRVMSPQPRRDDGEEEDLLADIRAGSAVPGWLRCPYGVVGDRLWVREAHQAFWAGEDPPDLGFAESRGAGWRVRYPSTDGLEDMYIEDRGVGTRCRPSIHMPRWASRITLEITDVRVERLQSISEEDAAAEGVDPTVILPGDVVSHVAGFGALWDAINHARAPWDSNPWVWVISFNTYWP